MSSSWTSLNRSSPWILRIAEIHRLNLRPFSNAAGEGSSSSSSSSFAEVSSSFKDPIREASSVGCVLLRFVSGMVVGSSLGFLLWSSDSFISFADSKAEEDHRHNEERRPRYLFGDNYRRRVFFNYEKRIRMNSPPEKVFEYFASFHTPEREVFMTPADLMRAVVPVFPPSESNIVREGYLRGERRPSDLKCADSEFFMLFDTNNDGLISFPEYIFLVTLLSLPETSFSVAFKMFDLDNSGEIDREEFKKVMSLMRSYNRQGAHHRDGLRNGIKLGSSVENGGLVEYFFGKDGNLSLPHEKFVEFLRDLHDEILHLEFAHYDYKLRGTISARDFALSMVASADMSHINKFLDRVDEINDDQLLGDIRITFEEFKAFAEVRKSVHQLALAMFSYGKVNGLLTKEDFQRAASHVCGIAVTDNMVDVIFHVFDANHDGNLSLDEFSAVLQKRELETARPTNTGLFSCWFNCAKNCTFARMVL